MGGCSNRGATGNPLGAGWAGWAGRGVEFISIHLDIWCPALQNASKNNKGISTTDVSSWDYLRIA